MIRELPTAPRPDSAGYRSALCLLLLMLALLSAISPLVVNDVAERVALMLVLGALVEIVHGFRRATDAGQWAAWSGGAITLGMGVLLASAPSLAGSALALFFAGWFALDAARNLAAGIRQRHDGDSIWPWYLAAAGNAVVSIGIVSLPEWATTWTVAIGGSVRLFGTATNIAMAAVFTAKDTGSRAVRALQLGDHPELEQLAKKIADEEAARVRADWSWILAYLATLLAIHIGRMGFDRTIFGLVSPGFAVLGDAFLGLAVAYGVVVPVSLVWRRLTRYPEQAAWRWCLAVPVADASWWRRAVRAALTFRLRFSIRFSSVRYSMRAALSRGLQIGLPVAAVTAATVPMWGMSWYFDTENWAAGIWNSWAEERTDTWRAAMADAIDDEQMERGPDAAFAVAPPDVPDRDDFSFIVIGDTGEGDASQHVLKASLLQVAQRPDVKFVVLSSDVIYPTGAMRDYERNFWLPFMGVTKPIYAIPGNHDWYDALDGFTATFLEPSAARRAMRARVEADHGLSSTTDSRIDELIATATRLREFYRVPVQQQHAPFFQFQTHDLALFVVDTGVAKRIDEVQQKWLEAALAAARGKTKLAILGHPLYAGGRYQADDHPDFAALHRLLTAHDVDVIMAGDTHDLEYYVERSGERDVLHFVNGGGGAYLSYGTSLSWPGQPATETWAYYPSRPLVEAKIEVTTPIWKRPAWWWTKRWNAWPFSAEWLSAAFDANTEPFHQSFVEVRVERSTGRLRFLPYGVHGRLRWSDFDASPAARPTDVPLDGEVEWSVPLTR